MIELGDRHVDNIDPRGRTCAGVREQDNNSPPGTVIVFRAQPMTPPVTPATRITSTAEITLVRPGWIEQRYREGAQFTPEALWENLGVIAAFSASGPSVLLNIFPAGMVVNLLMMNEDHFREPRPRENIRALAVVTDSAEMHTASKLYFIYHQQPFDTAVFEDEFDARAWLRDRMA